MVMMIMYHILSPPYTSPTRGFYMSLHACSMHKPWAKTMVLCTWGCMHKTIGLNHGFMHMVLYVCLVLSNTKYEKEIYKI